MEENEKPKSGNGCFNVGCLIILFIIAIGIIVGTVMLMGFHEFKYLVYFIAPIAIFLGLSLLVKHILNVFQKNDKPIFDKKHNYEEDDAKNYLPNKTKEPQKKTSESTKRCILIVIAAIVGLVLLVFTFYFANIIGILIYAFIVLYMCYKAYESMTE